MKWSPIAWKSMLPRSAPLTDDNESEVCRKLFIALSRKKLFLIHRRWARGKRYGKWKVFRVKLQQQQATTTTRKTKKFSYKSSGESCRDVQLDGARHRTSDCIVFPAIYFILCRELNGICCFTRERIARSERKTSCSLAKWKKNRRRSFQLLPDGRRRKSRKSSTGAGAVRTELRMDIRITDSRLHMAAHTRRWICEKSAVVPRPPLVRSIMKA